MNKFNALNKGNSLQVANGGHSNGMSLNGHTNATYVQATPLSLSSIPLSLSTLSIETCASSTNSESTTTSASIGAPSGVNNKSYNKFFNTFKSLFDIFDPDRKGYIDLYELESLGANQNEILNDIIIYLKDKYETSNNSIEINTRTFKKEFYVTFDTFVNAADIILKKRKLAKTLVKDTRKQKTLSDAFTFVDTPSHLQQIQQQEQATNNSVNTGKMFINRRVSDGVQTKPSAQQSSNEVNLKNANSFDLSILIEQEFNLLKAGLNELDKSKCIFEHKLNNIKQYRTTNKLKYQNLLSIDKMLLNLNELFEFNKSVCKFNEQNVHLLSAPLDPFESILTNYASDGYHSGGSSSAASTTGANANDEDLVRRFDKFIDEKQKRINYLNEEKSKLIRRLFEIKSNETVFYGVGETNQASGTIQQNDLEEMFFNNDL